MGHGQIGNGRRPLLHEAVSLSASEPMICKSNSSVPKGNYGHSVQSERSGLIRPEWRVELHTLTTLVSGVGRYPTRPAMTHVFSESTVVYAAAGSGMSAAISPISHRRESASGLNSSRRQSKRCTRAAQWMSRSMRTQSRTPVARNRRQRQRRPRIVHRRSQRGVKRQADGPHPEPAARPRTADPGIVHADVRLGRSPVAEIVLKTTRSAGASSGSRCRHGRLQLGNNVFHHRCRGDPVSQRSCDASGDGRSAEGGRS
jgi:hypothetical protein